MAHHSEKEVKLRLYKGKDDLSISLDKFFKTLKSISDTGKEKEFLEAHGAKTVTASPDVVNALKTHLFNHEAHLTDMHARAVVTSAPPPPGEPPTCFPKKSVA